MNQIEHKKYSRTISADSVDSLWMISELVEATSKVLDIGAGSGALGDYLTSRKNCQVDGIEKTPSLTHKTFPFYRNFYNVDIELYKLTDVILDGQYDYIILADIIEHLLDPGELLKQIPSLMSEGGHLLLSVPNIGHAGVIAGLLSGQFRYRDDGLLDATHLRFFTRSSLCDLLERHGFQVNSITPLRKNILETEFKEDFLDIHAPALVRTLLAQPDALTYQFIVDATYRHEVANIAKRPNYPVITEDNKIYFGCQLFWRSIDENYSSAQCVSASGIIGKARQNICFDLSHMKAPPDRLRLDLSDRPGLINLFSMRLIAANGEILWDWHDDMAYLAALRSEGIKLFPNDIKHCLLLTNDDSQIELDIPENLLRKLTNGASFIIEVGWPISADFAIALGWLFDSQADKELQLRNTHLEAEVSTLQMFNNEQAQTINRFRQQLDIDSQASTELQLRNMHLEAEISTLQMFNNEQAQTIDRFRQQLDIDSQANTELQLRNMRLETEVSTLQIFNNEQAQTIRHSRHALDEAIIEISNLVNSQSTENQANRELELRNMQLETEVATLQMLNSEQAQAISHMRHELDQAVIAISNLEKARNDIQASFFWRITKPFRYISSLLRRVRDIKNYGLLGNLEFPHAESAIRQNFVTVSGWVFSSTLPVATVYATVNGSAAQMLTCGYERPDVHQLYTSDAGALKSGFSGIVTWKRKILRRIKLDIWVEFQDGAKVRYFSRSIAYDGVKMQRIHLPLLYRFLSTSAKKAWRAFKEGRLPMSPALWWLGLRRNYIWMFGPERNRIALLPFVDDLSLVQCPYQQWIQTNRITPKLQLLMKSDAQHLIRHSGKKISIVVPVYNTPRRFLEEMIESVITQFYSNWELILVDDASTLEHVRKILQKASKQDDRIRIIFRPSNGHISEATNDGLNDATGDFVALLDHDDILPPDALLHIAECIALHSEVDWIYTDEDKIDTSGRRFDPQFKGAWNPDMAITHNYTHHLSVIRRELIHRAGGMRKGYEGAQDIDLFLRAAELTMPAKVFHVPQICYHWRSHEESTASQGTQKTYVFDSANRAIKDALIRRNISAELFLPPIALKYGMCLNQLRWKDSLGPGKEVTIVIPTKDHVNLLKRCISSLCETVDQRFVKLIIIDDRSEDVLTLQYLQDLENNNLLQCKVVRPKRGDGTFNYARLINEAAQYVDTPYFLQLNNDVEASDPGWLEDMMGWLSVDGVGVVGARLLYPDHTIQHAGVIIGPHGGLADHQFHQLPVNEVGYLALPHAARDVSAVTGACLLTSTDLFRSLGGFDEVKFAVEYNDVDFCLRVIERGKRIVYSPQATLTHLTSASRGKSYNPEEHVNFVKKYRQFKDAFYSSSIRQDSMWMPVNGGHFAHADRVKNVRVLFFSHELSLTGAPIVGYEFARYFSTVMGFAVTVVALRDGPIRQMYEENGISIKVLPELPDTHHMSAIEIQAMFKNIGESIHVGENYDLVVCNTLTTFWGVLLADHFKIPSIWHIHESVGIEKYAATFADPSIGNIVASAFFKANRVVFQANATRAMYSEFEALRNFCTISGGLPLARIEKFRMANSKSALRHKYNIPENAQVIALIGTTCERKGQTVFLDAILQMTSNSSMVLPDNLIFLMVGAIDGHYLDMLREKIGRYNLNNVQLIAATKDIYDYYGLSDLFVCASYEESFPMVVLLAMAFELSIVSTDVFGIPEIVSHQMEALLVPPGDSQSMAHALYQCINNEVDANTMAARAYAKACRLFDSDVLHTKHADLVRKVITENPSVTVH